MAAVELFFEDYSTSDEQTRTVLECIRTLMGQQNLVLVTHQVRITALTGGIVSQGEAVVVRPDHADGQRVLG